MAQAGTPGAALVTGAAKRIGRTLALTLAKRGHAVAVHYNGSCEEAKGVVAEIAGLGGKAMAIQADLGKEAQVLALFEQAQSLGPVTCVVNNASLFERDEALTATRASWDDHMEANLRAPFVLSQEMARALPADRSGVIVNMLDQRVWALTPHFTTYTVSKFALWGLTQTLALAFAPRIRVNGIGPGPALPSPRQSAEQFQAQARATPLGHGTNVEELARTLEFILDAPAMTGQMIALDGGQHLGWTFPPAGTQPED